MPSIIDHNLFIALSYNAFNGLPRKIMYSLKGWDFMKTTKWMNGLCALAVGAAVLGTAVPYASAYDGALNGNGEHKYDVRRGAYEQEGGSDIQVSRGRYEQPKPDEIHAHVPKGPEEKHPEAGSRKENAPEAKAPEAKVSDEKAPEGEVKGPEAKGDVEGSKATPGKAPHPEAGPVK